MTDFTLWNRATLEQFAQEAQGEPVGVVGSMPGASGFTMASFEANKVPVGTLLYTSATTNDAADEIERSRAAIAELIEAGRAVVERWESPLWKDLPNTGEYIYALRDVIAKHTTTTKEGN